MGKPRDYTDTCSWCNRGTNKLQTKKDGSTVIGLCPSCCPSLDADELPDTDTLPSSWYAMTEEQRDAWLDGRTQEDIFREAYREGELRPRP